MKNYRPVFSLPSPSSHLTDEAILFKGDPTDREVELVQAFLQSEEVSVHSDLHHRLSVDLYHQASPLLLHGDLRYGKTVRW